MKYDIDRAAELAESFNNGNRGDVVSEIEKYEPLHAAIMAVLVAECLAVGGGYTMEAALGAVRRALVARV